jgi:dTDP-4-dehydrorhamnose reductase
MTVGGVAVIGAAGYLGSAVCEAVAADAPVRRLVRTAERPDDERYDFWRDDLGTALAGAGLCVDAVIFSARVHPVSHADDSATMREYADRIRRVVTACAGRLLLVVSTDAVFRGDRGRYTEEQTPQPSTAYGRCARLIEEVVADEAERWCIVRPSYIYGVAPSGLDKRLARAVSAASAREPMDVHPDMFRSPIAVGDLAAAIRELVLRDVQGFVHAGGPRMSVADFFATGLAALGQPTDVLRRRPLSAGAAQPDTSLHVRRLLEKTSVVPRSVRDALGSAAQPSLARHP